MESDWDRAFDQLMVKEAVRSIRECGDARVQMMRRRRAAGWVVLGVAVISGLTPLLLLSLLLCDVIPTVWTWLGLPFMLVTVVGMEKGLALMESKPLTSPSGRDKRLHPGAWSIYLDEEILIPFGEGGHWRSVSGRMLTKEEEAQLRQWGTDSRGPRSSIAERFLADCGAEVADYLAFCQEHHLQPYEQQRMPLAWFFDVELFR